MIDRGNEFWTPEPIWRGETAFLLAGGPSLKGMDVDRLRGRRVMAINTAAYLAPWADVLFFTDNGWFESNTEAVAQWGGEVMTLSRHAKRKVPDRVKRLKTEHRPDFPPLGCSVIRQGRSSGHTAVALAVALGANRVVLLGYDMRIVDGASHFHDRYRNGDLELYARDFIPAFDGWRAAAEAAGVTVVNATPGSALTEFETTTVEAEIADRKASA